MPGPLIWLWPLRRVCNVSQRIIPCLDVKDGRVVKGVNFANIRDAGDPVALAKYYSDAGADEIVFLDITATHEARKTVADVVARTAEQVFVPLTVGGGIRTVEDFQLLLRAGADKISVNSAAVDDPTLITRAAERFGSQCIVLAADAKRRSDGRYEIVVEGGRRFTGMDLIDWVVRAEQLGAGEILLTSMDADGTKEDLTSHAPCRNRSGAYSPSLPPVVAVHWGTLFRCLSKRMPMRHWLRPCSISVH